MKKPNFFIVGAPKCGTTALYQYLEQHPDVFMPVVKEPFYFGTDLKLRLHPRISEERYLALFEAARDERAVGEATVWYLYSRNAANEIKAFSPGAKIIIMLRNPLQMIQALHGELLYCTDEHIADFEQALDAEEGRKKFLQKKGGNLPVDCLFYRDVGRYYEQVKRYVELFPREQVRIILFDDFVKDTAGVYRGALRFLGVDDAFQPDFAVVNPAKRNRSRLLHKLLYFSPRAYSIGKLFVPRRFRRAIRETLTSWNTTRISRAPVPPDVKERLIGDLSADISRLADLLGRDLDAWKK